MDLADRIFIAFYLDLILGDPRGFPHPIRYIGRFASFMENQTRKRITNLTFAGAVTTLTVVSLTGVICGAILSLLAKISPIAFEIGSIYLIYTTLSTRCLYDESLPVQQYLQKNDLPSARNSLSQIVGRETQDLDAQALACGATETVAENTVDGVIAPLFYAIIGGAPLALIYKAINTMDSMFGYKNEKYLAFGKIPARLDDVANWIPARLSVPLMTLAISICGFNGCRAYTTALRDGQNHSSPNAGLPEATVAGGLGIRMGGPNRYHGEWVDKPFIGEAIHPATARTIGNTHKIMFLAGTMALALFYFTRKLFSSSH